MAVASKSSKRAARSGNQTSGKSSAGEMPSGAMAATGTGLDVTEMPGGKGMIDARGAAPGSATNASAAATGEMPRGEMNQVQGAAMGSMPSGQVMPSGSMASSFTDTTGTATAEEMPSGSMAAAAETAPTAIEMPGTWKLTLTPVTPR